MITLDDFTSEIKEYNKVEYLKSILEKVNNGEGYLSLLGKHVIFNKFSIDSVKRDIDRVIKNKKKGIVSF